MLGVHTTRRDDLTHLAPGLRRFAHALVGDSAKTRPSTIADGLVLKALREGLTAQTGRWANGLKLFLYSTVIADNRARLQIPTTPLARGSERTSPPHHEPHTQQGSAAQAHIHSHVPVHATAHALQGSTFETHLHRLPLALREALLLVALEHLSHSEAAEVLQLGKPELVSLLLHARQRMAVGGGTNLRVIK